MLDHDYRDSSRSYTEYQLDRLRNFSWIQASQQFVYGDYRVVELLGRRNAHESTAQLAAEIVLRTSTW